MFWTADFVGQPKEIWLFLLYVLNCWFCWATKGNMAISIICSELLILLGNQRKYGYFYYMFWTADFVGQPKEIWLFLLYVLNCWFCWATKGNIAVSIICSELLILLGDQLSLTVHVHKLECLVKRLLCCIQGQSHSEGSELQWMFARTISLIGQT